MATLTQCPLFQNDSYSCGNPYPNCTNAGGFQFSSLWTISQYIYLACADDWRIFDKQTGSLSQAACEQIVGSDYWTWYAAADIWARLTTWKFPLLQLVAIFPRPPLSFNAEMLVIFRLLGNPVGTIRGLLLKMASCQGRAIFWEREFRNDLSHLVRYDSGIICEADLMRNWKAMATITDSYDEWGQDAGDVVQQYLLKKLTQRGIKRKEKARLLAICHRAARALAADRSTKFLPIIVAQSFFIGTEGIAFGRTKASASRPNPSTYINIEAHSIAFSALFFWIIAAVFFSAVIGVSQTENAIPQILHRFQQDLSQAFPSWDSLPNDYLLNQERMAPAAEEETTDGELYAQDLIEKSNTALRERSGGIYSWFPNKARKEVVARLSPQNQLMMASEIYHPEFLRRLLQRFKRMLSLEPGSLIFTLIIVVVPTLIGVLISVLVPPVGWEARTVAEALISGTWVLNGMLDYVNWGYHHRWEFWFTFSKDCICALAIMSGIIVAQVGVFNRCSSYTLWGKSGLALPEISNVAGTLSQRIGTVYPAIAFLCIAFELIVFPATALLTYPHAVRIFLQRDDDTSNMRWWHVICALFSRTSGPSYRRTASVLQRGLASMSQGLKMKLRGGHYERDIPLNNQQRYYPGSSTEGSYSSIGPPSLAYQGRGEGPHEPQQPQYYNATFFDSGSAPAFAHVEYR